MRGTRRQIKKMFKRMITQDLSKWDFLGDAMAPKNEIVRDELNKAMKHFGKRGC